MTIDDLIRTELRDVADTVEIPPMPSLDEERSRWLVPLVAAVVLVLLTAAGLWLDRSGRADQSPPPVKRPEQTVTALSTAPPTIPWIDDGRFYVNGRRLPGRWLEVATAGDTWLAQREDHLVFWGRDPQPHLVGRDRYFRMWELSAIDMSGGGRFVMYVHARSSTVTLIDTETGRSRTVAQPDDCCYNGVSESAAIRVLTPDLGPPTEGLTFEDQQGRPWVVQRRYSRFAARRQDLRRDAVSRQWSVSPSPDRRWILDLEWARYGDEPATVSVRTAGSDRVSRIEAPAGWRFAPRLAPGYWEPGGTLILFVVTPETRTYRAARCAPDLGACVLVEEP